MDEKFIEIYYDIADLPSGYGGTKALKFRNAAMGRIEAAMVNAGAGEWTGAEIGQGEVNFGFSVDDFDAAEAVVRAAVAGTEFEGIREIQRREFDPEDFADEVPHDIPLKFRVLQVVLPLILLPIMIVFAVLNVVRRMFGKRAS